jgi:hypothetical protein
VKTFSAALCAPSDVGIEPHHLALIGTCPHRAELPPSVRVGPDHPLTPMSWPCLLSSSSSSSSFCSPRFRHCRIAPREGRVTTSSQLGREQPGLPSVLDSPAAKPRTRLRRTTHLGSEPCRSNCKTPWIDQLRLRRKDCGLEKLIVLPTVGSVGQPSGSRAPINGSPGSRLLLTDTAPFGNFRHLISVVAGSEPSREVPR